MKFKSCALLATALLLLMSGATQAKEFPLDASLAAHPSLRHSNQYPTPFQSIEENCTVVVPTLAPPGSTTGGVETLFESDPIGDSVRYFRSVQVAEHKEARCRRRAIRLAIRRAKEAREAKYVDESNLEPPEIAPQAVKDVIVAANSIATTPYVWGGGHGAWDSYGYDCSGSVSFALHGAGLLDAPLVSGDLESYGEAGPGKWITIYANAEHVYAVIAGFRWDTRDNPDPEGSGARWHEDIPSSAGFVARHPAGY
jgi:hypothetical protein